MIIITFGIKKTQEGYTHKEIWIGHGIPTWGQLSFLSQTTVYKDNDGNTVFAESNWSL